MSPRRRTRGVPAFDELSPRPQRRWGLAVVMTFAVTLVVAAVTVNTLLLITHEKHRRAELRAVAAIGTVRAFMTQYTSLDPFHANDYADRVLAQVTGGLAQDYKARLNEILVQVARAEPTQGQVLDAGVERWNDDGSANVVVATQITTTMPDGKMTERGNRWVATAIQEGEQWKISNLLKVI